MKCRRGRHLCGPFFYIETCAQPRAAVFFLTAFALAFADEGGGGPRKMRGYIAILLATV